VVALATPKENNWGYTIQQKIKTEELSLGFFSGLPLSRQQLLNLADDLVDQKPV
jgi:hypothetical protein